MRPMSAAIAALVFAGSLSAQQPPAKEKMAGMDHGKMDKMMEMDHASGPWKELNAYHELMMATWHPAAAANSDLSPTRAKISDMVVAANTLAASTAPKGCDAPKVKAAVAALPKETQSVADLVAKKADDATLKGAMKSLHQKFEVLEMGCETPKKETK